MQDCIRGKAVLNAAYLLNRLPSNSIDKTPIEFLSGEKPDLSLIRIIGSRVFSPLHAPERKK